MKQFLVLVCLLCVSVSCAKVSDDQYQQSTKQKEKITIGFVTFPGYGPFYVAKEKAMYDDTDVNLVRIESIGDLRAALKSGTIDMFSVPYDTYLNATNDDAYGIAIAAIDESYGADGIIVSESIASLDSLKTKEIAIEPGFPAYFMLKYELFKKGMTINDIKVRELPTQDACNAFVAKKFDAVGVYEPCMSASVTARKGARVLFSSKDTDLPIQDILFASPKAIQEKKDAVKDVVNGWFQAVDFTNTQNEEALSIMAKEFGITVEDMKAFKETIIWVGKDKNKAVFRSDNSKGIEANIRKVQQVLQSNGEPVITKNSSELIDSQFVN